jgi:hypothetical protein
MSRPLPKIQFSIVLVNRNGELAALADLLAKAGVNVEALAISDGVHVGVVKLVVSDPAAARNAFQSANLSFHEQEILALSLPNRPGALAQLCATLAEAGHSIDYVYGSACSCAAPHDADCRPMLMVAVGDRRAVETLEKTALWPGP